MIQNRMKRWLFVVLMVMVSLSIGACKKEELPPEAEKVFSLEKEQTTTGATVDQQENLTYVLYLKAGETPFLVDELQVVPQSDYVKAEANLPLYALDKLLTVTTIRELVNPIPLGTEVIKLEVVDGTAKVDLTKAFTPAQMDKEVALLAVAAIVNTLTYFDGIDQVELYVEGEKLNQYYGQDLSEPLVFFEGLYPEK